MSSSAGIGIICWWYWSKRMCVLVKKKHFPAYTSSLHSHFRWLSPSLEVHIGQEKYVYDSKKPFHVSTEACNLKRCTHSCPCKVPGPPSWVLDAIGQPGLSLSLAAAVPMELVGPRGQYGCIQFNKIGHVCLLACTLSVLPGLWKRFLLTNKNISSD